MAQTYTGTRQQLGVNAGVPETTIPLMVAGRNIMKLKSRSETENSRTARSLEGTETPGPAELVLLREAGVELEAQARDMAPLLVEEPRCTRIPGERCIVSA